MNSQVEKVPTLGTLLKCSTAIMARRERFARSLRLSPLMSLLWPVLIAATFCNAQDARAEDWVIERDEATGISTYRMNLTIYPAAEPRPALKTRFIADEFERYDGNSATFYLKAMGFFEQSNSRQILTEFFHQQSEKVSSGELEPDEMPPYTWLKTPPSELPIQEVKEFLRPLAFQPWFLSEATKRREFELDREIRQVENPIGYLLPEIQSFRQAARWQSLRCRVAIAENRVDDAIQILGQQFAMANHLSQDQFFVSALVGCAIHGIAANDALYLQNHPDTPNLYWAYASLPQPLVQLRDAYAFERQFLYEQVKVLREVDEQPRSAGYWQDFARRLLPQIQGLEIEGFRVADKNASPMMQQAQLAMRIAAAYPGARRYLIDEYGMDAIQVDQYPTTQVVMLALTKFYDELRDERFKWRFVDYAQAVQQEKFLALDKDLEERTAKIGWAGEVGAVLFPALHSLWAAENRVQMFTALSQTVAAIRDYAAANDGKLPHSLAHLPLPAPENVFTGNPIDYEYINGNGVLLAKAKGMQFRLVLTAAK